MGRYRVIEEAALADCAFEIDGRDLHDLFETAALALAELMVDPTTVATTVRRRITVSAPALDLLLYDWLGELIFRKDRDREVFPRTTVRIIESEDATLVADVAGGRLDAPGTALRADPKAVTLHQFALERAREGWRARLVIDI
jgi:SHS2 domain-containing protein